ncbi:hypothetical protein GCM10009730_33300 [Streptomyces albidochromogenes]|uniref:hypothetical protein n=1 Tax=Streptomyces albidochromogenes TaxID=329524 RepID=UPI00110FDB1E|nr:hypothetical protein [Streptomyces albidochromogenes]
MNAVRAPVHQPFGFERRRRLIGQPDEHGRSVVTGSRPRDTWGEIQDVAARWRAADEPGGYRLTIDPGGTRRATAHCGRPSWRLAGPPTRDHGGPW